jgi:hypothetical protein
MIRGLIKRQFPNRLGFLAPAENRAQNRQPASETNVLPLHFFHFFTYLALNIVRIYGLGPHNRTF